MKTMTDSNLSGYYMKNIVFSYKIRGTCNSCLWVLGFIILYKK